MFTVQHFIWLGITAIIIFFSLFFLLKNRPSLKDFLTICCYICIASELIKIFSTVKIVPSSDGSLYFPYLQTQHLPFHLCSIQIIFIFYARFAKDGKVKDRLLGFMYPTTIIGALFALALPSIFSTTISINQAFTHPMAYQFFSYHAMLIVAGVYIFVCKKETFTTSYYFSTELILFGIAIISIYVNSMVATPVYKNGELVSLEYITNFFYTIKTPVGILLKEKWQWFIYLGILIALAFLTIGIAYIPIFVKSHKNKKVD